MNKIHHSVILIFFLSFSNHFIFCQDLSYPKEIVKQLTSETFWGRGYTKNGMSKASAFLVEEFKKIGLQPFSGKSYTQEFYYPVNTFPGKMSVSINGTRLHPGQDFIVSPESHGAQFSGRLIQIDSNHFTNKEKTIEVVLQDKLMWSVATEEKEHTTLFVQKKNIKDLPTEININIENEFISHFKASNVCGVVKGTEEPDSLIVITAHYDHLGGMGSKTYFPGANDNSSGIALLLSLAQYYSNHPLKYSVGFICFAGEEAGLLGSNFFVHNSLVQLNQIRFLINLDLTGTGDDGITVVNGSVLKNEFNILNEINNQNHYLSKIKSRGKAANSDHYWFSEQGVSSFFIYTMGGIQAYHDVYDKYETLPLTEFQDLKQLIIDFNAELLK